MAARGVENRLIQTLASTSGTLVRDPTSKDRVAVSIAGVGPLVTTGRLNRRKIKPGLSAGRMSRPLNAVAVFALERAPGAEASPHATTATARPSCQTRRETITSA